MAAQAEGYRLLLVSNTAPRVFGREHTVTHLEAWLADADTPPWIVGLPGMRRKTVVDALPTQPVTIHIATQMPAAPPSVRALRLGPLSDKAAAELLVDRVLERRGAVALGPDEVLAVPVIVRSAGGHPATLAAVADQAVLHTLDALAAHTEGANDLRSLPGPRAPATGRSPKPGPRPRAGEDRSGCPRG